MSPATAVIGDGRASRSGIYALIDLNGAPVAAGDAAIMGFDAAPTAALARAAGGAQPGAVQADHSPDRITILLGFLDDLGELTRALGLSAEASPLDVARAALDRFGARTPARMIGEWSLLDWRADGRVVLMSSAARRDPILFARSGRHLAVAPDLALLSRLGRVGRAIDPEGLMFELGRYTLRRHRSDRTMLAGVRMLEPGASLWIDRDETRIEHCAVLEPVADFRGSFMDAVKEAEDLLRHIVRQRLERTPGVACLLSGGLDSSLLTWAAHEGRMSRQDMVCLTSAAPLGSGLRDETGMARIVAEHLGLPMYPVVPPLDASPYRPAESHFALGNGPPLSSRHYVYDALCAQAAALGLPILFDGAFGEMTLTGPMPLATPRHWIRQTARRLLGRRDVIAPRDSAFHVRLARHRLIAPPEGIAALLGERERPRPAARLPRERWSYFPGAEKILAAPAELRPGEVRQEYPFRDVRLLRLFAGFPAQFLVQNGLDRAPARTMLASRLPDSIRLRRGGMPFSPDYMVRLQTMAPAAIDRIAAFRRAEIDDWLDLDWLERRLRRIAAVGTAGVVEAFEVQLSAVTAEYLLWWRGAS